MPVAVSVFHHIDADAFRRGFGIFLASYASYMLLRPRVAAFRGGRISDTAVGFAGGVVGGLTAMPGAVPTVWCDLRGMAKDAQRGMVQPFITTMQVLAVLLFLTRPQKLPATLFLDLLISLPGLAIGTFIGLKLFGKVDELIFRGAVLALLLVSGLMLVL